MSGDPDSMPEIASDMRKKNPAALVKIFKVLDTECSSIHKRLLDRELNLELQQPLTRSAAIDDH
jgi:hypothetical protein